MPTERQRRIADLHEMIREHWRWPGNVAVLAKELADALEALDEAERQEKELIRARWEWQILRESLQRECDHLRKKNEWLRRERDEAVKSSGFWTQSYFDERNRKGAAERRAAQWKNNYRVMEWHRGNERRRSAWLRGEIDAARRDLATLQVKPDPLCGEDLQVVQEHLEQALVRDDHDAADADASESGAGRDRPHIDSEGRFQSDKYPWCKPDFVPLKVSDEMARDLLVRYAERHREVDPQFADDLLYRMSAFVCGLDKRDDPTPDPTGAVERKGDCSRCHGEGWVCERHPYNGWRACVDAKGCGGAGKLCPQCRNDPTPDPKQRRNEVWLHCGTCNQRTLRLDNNKCESCRVRKEPATVAVPSYGQHDLTDAECIKSRCFEVWERAERLREALDQVSVDLLTIRRENDLGDGVLADLFGGLEAFVEQIRAEDEGEQV